MTFNYPKLLPFSTFHIFVMAGDKDFKFGSWVDIGLYSKF